HLIWPVDLGFLQAVRVVDVDRFPFSAEINGANAAFTVAVACGFHAAEREVYFSANGGSIDVSNAGLQVTHGGERLVHDPGVQRGGEAVLDIVSDLDRVFEVFTGND